MRYMTTYFYHQVNVNDLNKVDAFLQKYGLDNVDRDGQNFLMTAIIERKNIYKTSYSSRS